MKAAQGLLDRRQPQLDAAQTLAVIAQGAPNRPKVLEDQILSVAHGCFSSPRVSRRV
jgi:hypothetical protein